MPDARGLFMVGTSFRRLGFSRLGELALPTADDDAVRALQRALDADELLLVSTCNRFECYGVGPTRPPGARAQALSTHLAAGGATLETDALLDLAGVAAARHLLRVSASLDSLVPGETEITGQVRSAQERAEAIGCGGPTLRALTQRAVRTAAHVRRETALGKAPSSLAGVAVRKVRQRFGDAGPRTSVLLGVGPMCRKAARALADASDRLLVINRTLPHAEDFCARYGGQPLALDAFLAAPPADVDLLFCATSAPEPVIRAPHLAPSLSGRDPAHGPLVVVDLALPRDVDPAIDAHPAVHAITLGDMAQASFALRGEARQAYAEAEAQVEAALRAWLHEQQAQQLAARALDGFLDRQLTHLDAGERAALQRFFQGVAGRIARHPQPQIAGSAA